MGAWRAIKHRWRVRRAVAEIAARPLGPGRPHGLPWPLVVSLTSYPARFGTLELTLRSLLLQTVRADETVLWVAEGEAGRLPPGVLELRDLGLTVAETRDLRSYKKIVPALAAHPDAAIVTADDDVYYHPTWLAELAGAADGDLHVPCGRAHRIALAADGTIGPYEAWPKNIGGPAEGPLVFPTGVKGVLYPPGSLHGDVGRVDLFQELCPTADDVWLWWMHRLAGRRARKMGPPVRVLEWPGSQVRSLRQVNQGVATGNDRAVAALVGRYGLPLG
jgi:hypothetical protein